MKQSILLISALLLLFSCNIEETNFDQLDEACRIKPVIGIPDGFELNAIGEIDFNGSAQQFQFITDQIGFALLSNSVGGYVEVFKTADGGATWTDMSIGIDQAPIGMAFKDAQIGIITVHDVTGCPSSCQNKTVVLKTEDGGTTWEQLEIAALQGILYHPKFDGEGNLYATLKLDATTTLMKSTDNGETWNTFFASTELDFSLVTYSYEYFNDQFFVSGTGGKILVVDKNGDLVKTIETGKSTIWDVEVIDENNIIVVSSSDVIKSSNGGDTWQTIVSSNGRMIGFNNAAEGLMLLQQSICPTDVAQVNDFIASTTNGGSTWLVPSTATTNLKSNFVNSQKIIDKTWYFMVNNKLFEIKE